jgi:hypothetical protein
MHAFKVGNLRQTQTSRDKEVPDIMTRILSSDVRSGASYSVRLADFCFSGLGHYYLATT